MRSKYLVACFGLVAACGFSVSPGASQDGGPGAMDSAVPSDGEIDPDAAVDAYIPDAAVCFGAGLGAVCLTSAPSMPLVLPNNPGFDTGGANCTEVVTLSSVEHCVLAGTAVELPAANTFRAIGSRPLIVLGTTNVDIQGVLSVSSPRGFAPGAGASVASCGVPAVGETDAGGAGGGAGGSFRGRGGNGGIGDTNNNGGPPGMGMGGIAHAPIVPTVIRGGCPGASGGDGNKPRGAGGAAGGAVYVISGGSIQLTGHVRASGSGGSPGNDGSGGGGGGSGGMIGFDAPMTTISGTAVANGGGGGEGGGFEGGQAGANGTNGTDRAPGGAINVNGGNGGLGSGGVFLDGGVGGNETGGGGGGGGGAGYIYIKGAVSGPGVVSPAASVTP